MNKLFFLFLSELVLGIMLGIYLGYTGQELNEALFIIVSFGGYGFINYNIGKEIMK